MNAAPDPRTVVLVVSGGIAAYKSCEIVRRLRDHGLEVRVAMTRAATRFVAPLTYAALSAHEVISDLWEPAGAEEIPHVRWAEACDLLCVAPATADFIAKMAHGIADDFASTLHLAVTAPVLVAPAMEDDMYRHPSVQRNLGTLEARGVQLIGPAAGALASGRQGPGRMVEPAEIVEAALTLLESGECSRSLQGTAVVVTAGPTREPIDPIRYLSNRSSGRMGYALAALARDLGAEVTLVTGPTALPRPHGMKVIEVETAAAMARSTLAAASDADIMVMAAAVADFSPSVVAEQKLKKRGRSLLSLELGPTTDILLELGNRPERPLLVGFAAETEDVESRAREKLELKSCDLIVANRVGDGVGMGAADNEVVILDRRGGRVEAGPAAKRAIALTIWRTVTDFRAGSDG